MTMKKPLTLAPTLSTSPWRQVFADEGRVHIPNFLSETSADQLFQCLDQQGTWNLVCQQDGQHVDLNDTIESVWSAEQLALFTKKLHEQATDRFQYLYRTIPLYDVFHQNLLPGHFLNEVFFFLNSPAFLDYLRATLDMPEIGFADAQATCFSGGHFLNKHDDNVPGKRRLAAYVLNLTPSWNTNWGGALQFYDASGACTESFFPSYNALNVFRVPQPHAVTYVPPFATGKRLSITGWLREGEDPSAGSS